MQWWEAEFPMTNAKRQERIDALHRQVASAQRELRRLHNLASDPGNAGTTVRWRSDVDGTYMAARRQRLGEWDVTGQDGTLSWDELLDVVGHATLELAESWTTLQAAEAWT